MKNIIKAIRAMGAIATATLLAVSTIEYCTKYTENIYAKKAVAALLGGMWYTLARRSIKKLYRKEV